MSREVEGPHAGHSQLFAIGPFKILPIDAIIKELL